MNPRLATCSATGGCGAKLAPALLHRALSHVEKMDGPSVLVGMKHPDDAGVVLLPGGQRLVQTVDIIAPIVNDPAVFGRIAAANALSDVYAMGGRPVAALNVTCFPSKTWDLSVLEATMRGAIEVLHLAGCPLVGGHSVMDEAFKFGFAISGLIEGGEVLSIDRAVPGQVLVLTKPLGTGVINKALRAGAIDDSARVMFEAEQSMTTLNARATQAARVANATAATDVTGFGLLGHATQFATASGVTFSMRASAIHSFSQVRKLIESGFAAGRAKDNREAYAERVRGIGSDADAALFFDPQTSGGLLVAMPENGVPVFMDVMGDLAQDCRVVGRVIERQDAAVILA